MSAIALVLSVIGGIVMLVAGVMLLIKAFQQSVLWGLGCLFLGPVSLIFVIMYWQDTKKVFLYQLAGLAVMVVGLALGGAAASMSAN
jgi:hypothetical protein